MIIRGSFASIMHREIGQHRGRMPWMRKNSRKMTEMPAGNKSCSISPVSQAHFSRQENGNAGNLIMRPSGHSISHCFASSRFVLAVSKIRQNSPNLGNFLKLPPSHQPPSVPTKQRWNDGVACSTLGVMIF